MSSLRRRLERGKKKQGKPRGAPVGVSQIELSELKAILARAMTGPLGDIDVDKLRGAVDTLAFLTRELEAKGASIQRLRRMLFGPSTEKTSQIVGSKGDASGGTSPVNASSSEPAATPPKDGAASPTPAADSAPAAAPAVPARAGRVRLCHARRVTLVAARAAERPPHALPS